MTDEETLVVRSVRPDLVDAQGNMRYTRGSDMDIEINLQYPIPVGRARVIANGLRVRRQPGTAALQIGSLTAGDTVNIWGTVGDWSLVCKGKLQGWSASRYLDRIA